MAQTGEPLSRSRSRSSDQNERLEPQLLKAAEADDVEALRIIIDAADARKQLGDNFLRIALMRSSEKGKVNATRYLLERGAPPNGALGNRLSPLLLAIEGHDTPVGKGEEGKGGRLRNNTEVIQVLLEYGADTETADKKGRTALMNALLKPDQQRKEMLKKEQQKKIEQEKKEEQKKDQPKNEQLKQLKDAQVQPSVDEQPKIGPQKKGRPKKGQYEQNNEQQEDDQRKKQQEKSEQQKNYQRILHMLIVNGANLGAADNKGRTVLMTAAWTNQWHILNMLIVKGADVNAKDLRKRNVLHNLAADPLPAWGDSVIDLLLEQNVDIDGDEVGEKGQDGLGRSPLHWACATGKLPLAEKLLSRANGPRAKVDATEMRGKTALHIAAAHDRDDIVQMLLDNHANVNARSDGGWTPLHNACEKGCNAIVGILIGKGAEINAKLLNGMTPLHVAAQEDHVEVVERLLKCKDIKRTSRDTFGSTAFLRAAQKKRKEIVHLLAPFNNLDTMSRDALGACNGFTSTIVDFGNFRNDNRVTRKTVFGMRFLFYILPQN